MEPETNLSRELWTPENPAPQPDSTSTLGVFPFDGRWRIVPVRFHNLQGDCFVRIKIWELPVPLFYLISSHDLYTRVTKGNIAQYELKSARIGM